jgi:hypothetical protein
MGSEVSNSPDPDLAKCLEADSLIPEPKYLPLIQLWHHCYHHTIATLPITASVTTLFPFAIVPVSLLFFTYVLSHWTKLSIIKSVLHTRVDKRIIFRISQFSKLTNITLSYAHTVLCATFMSRNLVSFYINDLCFQAMVSVSSKTKRLPFPPCGTSMGLKSQEELYEWTTVNLEI